MGFNLDKMASPQTENGQELRKQFIIKYPNLSKNREVIYKRDEYKCFYCGLEVIDYSKFCDLIDERQEEELEKLRKELITPEEYEVFNAREEIEKSDLYKSKMATLDHKIPLVKGGTNDEENLITCCKSCNSRKKDNIQLENGYTKIANGLLEKFAKVQMSGSCWQVLMAILRKLYGYNKKEDWIEYSQITEISGLSKSRISHSIKQLCKYGIVAQKRNGIRQIIGINKDFGSVARLQNSYVKQSKVLRKSATNRSVNTHNKRKKENTKEINQPTAKAVGDINPIFSLFEKTINPTINYGNVNQRKAIETLIKKVGLDKTIAAVKYAITIQTDRYAPTITTPIQLLNKYGELQAYYIKHNKQTNQKGIIL